MNMMTSIGARQLDALRAEFGAIVAQRIFEAEAADFLWEARVRERYLGQHVGDICDETWAFEDVSRIACLSLFDGVWHAGICLVDGEGNALELAWSRRFEGCADAEFAYDRAH